MLSTLYKSSGSNKAAKRLGRGNSSGKGTYSGKGLKGQKARAGKGSHVPAHFEWGQTPLHRRLPKLRWFKRYFKSIEEIQVVNLAKIEAHDACSATITKEVLQACWFIADHSTAVKILWQGNFTKKLQFEGIEYFSESARTKITSAGGSIA